MARKNLSTLTDLSNKMSLILDRMSDLATMDEFKAVTDGISQLSQKVVELTEKLSDIEPLLTTAEECISKVQADVQKLMENPPINKEEDLIAEISDRSRRLHNVILYNVPESTKTLPNDKKSEDLDVINKIYATLKVTLPNQVSYFRVGKSGNRCRPLIFKTQEDALNLLKKFSSEDIAKEDEELSERKKKKKKKEKSALLYKD